MPAILILCTDVIRSDDTLDSPAVIQRRSPDTQRPYDTEAKSGWPQNALRMLPSSGTHVTHRIALDLSLRSREDCSKTVEYSC